MRPLHAPSARTSRPTPPLRAPPPASTPSPRRRAPARRVGAPPPPAAGATAAPRPTKTARTDIEYDAVIVGAGMGGLTVASQLAAAGQRVVVLEAYVVPGGSGAHFERGGCTFDVGASMMFGLGPHGTTNLITRALAAVGKAVDTVPDPTQIHYHLPPSPAHPAGLDVKVWRSYDEFVAELVAAFPHEEAGIKRFYGECWRVFDALNALDLKSLEEPRYLMGEFLKRPLACLTLASFLATNTGDVARRHIRDPELLAFIDMECYCWSTVAAASTPMINAGMVFCDRHYGGINYPVGGTGVLAAALAAGVAERGGAVEYGARVVAIDVDAATGRAVAARTADGRAFRGRAIVSNATRWDTFERLLAGGRGAAAAAAPAPAAALPPSEARFFARYAKAPSFLSIHACIDAAVLPAGTQCHHIVLEEWGRMEDARGTLFVSIPSLLDPSLCPAGTHIFHAFTPDWVTAYDGLDPAAYTAAKEAAADAVLARLEAAAFPGLRGAVRFREVGTPRTHRRFLNRVDGSYGPVPSRRPAGMLGMPFNTTDVPGLYCVGDSTFPGQGVNAVVFSGVGCAHRVLVDAGARPAWPAVDGAFRAALAAVRGLV